MDAEDLARELQLVGRTGIPLALVMLDLDGLKEINDKLGHQVGDERIQGLADAIRESRRATDVGYRIGGDEFAVILPGSRALGALEFAGRVRALAATVPGRGRHDHHVVVLANALPAYADVLAARRLGREGSWRWVWITALLGVSAASIRSIGILRVTACGARATPSP